MSKPPASEKQPPPPLLFTDRNEDRNRNFIIRMSDAERKLLEDGARARGVSATNLVRMCVRQVLIETGGEVTK